MDLPAYFEEFQKILVVCPHDGEVYRLADLRLFYDSQTMGSWYDTCMRELYALNSSIQELEKRKEQVKAENTRNADTRLMSYIPDADPFISRFPYDGRDMKLLIDPIEFIVFEGMHKEDVQNVILLDRNRKDKERLHDSIREVIAKERYDWITLLVNEKAKLIPSWSYFTLEGDTAK